MPQMKLLPKSLKTLWQKIEDEFSPKCKTKFFNSCLINFYQNGFSHIPPHRDDEPCLGAEPFILSISIGAARTFILQNDDKKAYSAVLKSGTLLTMQGKTQERWTHQVPPEHVNGARINLTFRKIVDVI